MEYLLFNINILILNWLFTGDKILTLLIGFLICIQIALMIIPIYEDPEDK